MSRLPDETLENAISVYKTCIENAAEYDDDCEYNPILDRATVKLLEELKEYRKTGLTPEQIYEMDKMYAEQATELGKYKKLEEQSLLLKLPCKVGATVYSCECGMIVRDFVRSFTEDENGLWAINIHGGIIGLLGSSVFVTLEEAEKALAEMGE